MNKQNLHTHTTYTDGRDTPEEMIQTAIDKGFDAIGFSEHSPLSCSKNSKQLFPERMRLYCEEVRGLKQKYAGQLDIFCGLEYDFYSDLDTDGLDYLIGSVHCLDCDGGIASFDYSLEQTIEYVRRYFGGDGMRFAQGYFETLARLPEKKNFDILGHFDILAKNNGKGRFFDTSDKRYLDMGYEAIHALRGKIPFFEVNTGAIARGYTDAPYPQMEFLQELKRCGFGALITSDCHDRNYLDCYFDEARELLTAAGFRSRWILTDGGFCEVEV